MESPRAAGGGAPVSPFSGRWSGLRFAQNGPGDPKKTHGRGLRPAFGGMSPPRSATQCGAAPAGPAWLRTRSHPRGPAFGGSARAPAARPPGAGPPLLRAFPSASVFAAGLSAAWSMFGVNTPNNRTHRPPRFVFFFRFRVPAAGAFCTSGPTAWAFCIALALLPSLPPVQPGADAPGPSSAPSGLCQAPAAACGFPAPVSSCSSVFSHFPRPSSSFMFSTCPLFYTCVFLVDNLCKTLDVYPLYFLAGTCFPFSFPNLSTGYPPPLYSPRFFLTLYLSCTCLVIFVPFQKLSTFPPPAYYYLLVNTHILALINKIETSKTMWISPF